MDAHQASRVTDQTTQRYRASLKPFLKFLIDQRFAPEEAAEFDDLLVEWKRSGAVTKSNFEGAVAAIEFACPQLKGRLPWARSVIHSWSVVHQAAHTVPMCEGPARLVGIHLSADGHPRLGAGVIVQHKTGMRPSEMLGIRAGDVQLPSAASASPFVVIGLGIRAGTKAKRAQCVLVRDPVVTALVSWLVHHTRPDELLVPYSYEQYRRLLIRIRKKLKIEIEWTPHSPRAGFASDQIACGTPFATVKELGRWQADQSLRTYVDVVSAAAISVNLRLAGFQNSLAFAVRESLTFVPGAEAFAVSVPAPPTIHAADGMEEGGRCILSSGHGLDGAAYAVGVRDADAEEVEVGHAAASSPARGSRARGRGSGHREVSQQATQGLRVRGRGRGSR